MITSVKTTKLTADILQISLNNPDQLNILSTDILQSLAEILKNLKTDLSVKAVLLTGEGKAFCAGADIKQLEGMSGVAGLKFARFGQAVFRELERLGIVSLAAIQGFAFGGGCELAMAATLRIASSTALFAQPEIKLGVIPGFGGTQRLPKLIGKGRALEMLLTGRRFTAQEALQWGFLNEVVAPENLIARATEILQGIVKMSPIVMQSMISVVDHGNELPLEKGAELEAAHFGFCCTTLDKEEGVTAFLEKRSAIFKGE